MNRFDCDVYMDLMPLVKDGVASEASSKALRQHLAVCEKCRSQFDDMPEVPQPYRDEGWNKLKKRLRLGTVLSIALATLCVLIPLTIAAIFGGNPIIENFIEKDAQEYLQENYPGNDFEIFAPRYQMKSMSYEISVRSRSSRDIAFVLTYGYFGGDCWDGYESMVLSGNNTFSRICEDVKNMVEPVLVGVLDGADSYSVGLNSDWPSIYDEFGDPFTAPEEIVVTSLEVDGEYDPAQLSARYGHVEIHREVEQTSAEEIAGILTDVYAQLVTQEIAVRTLSVTVYDEEASMTVAGFLFEEIPSEDLLDKIQKNADAYVEFEREYNTWLMDNQNS